MKYDSINSKELNYKKIIKRIYNISIIVIATSFLAILGVLIFKEEPIRLYGLINKYYIEIIFLFATGYFLYSFGYDVSNIRISFNSFIIYCASNILKDSGTFQNIAFVFLFALIYITSQYIVEIILNRKFIFDKFIEYLMKIILWGTLIYLYNLILVLFNFNIKDVDIKFINILVVIIIIISHSLIKSLFTFIESIPNEKRAKSITQFIIYLSIESFLILYAIIIGSIYQTIGILSTATLVIFFALVIIFSKFLIHYNYNLEILFALAFFLRKAPVRFSFYRTIKPFDVVNKSIKELIFVVFDDYEGRDELDLKFIKIKRDFLSTIINIEDTTDRFAELEPIIENSRRVVFCRFKRENFEKIDIFFVFRVLNRKIKKMDSNSSLKSPLELKEDFFNVDFF
jgi:hypothetical protein